MGKYSTFFPGSGAGEGEGQGRGLLQTAEGAVYTYKYKQAFTGSWKGFCDFCQKFRIFKNHIQVPMDKILV